MSLLARDVGLIRQGLDKALSAEGNPSFATISKVARALGLRVTFRAASGAFSAPRRHGSRMRRRAA